MQVDDMLNADQRPPRVCLGLSTLYVRDLHQAFAVEARRAQVRTAEGEKGAIVSAHKQACFGVPTL